jgi:hypothetical protein
MSPSAPSADEIDQVARLLGRPPGGRFRIVVRRVDGSPVVIENAPHLDDGTPMPTLFWLVDPSLREQVSRVESLGGVKRLEATLDPHAVDEAHQRYARRREALVEHPELPQPSGGVGGTRTGLKCLHAHLAAFLAGLEDVAGRAVSEEIELGVLDPAPPVPVEG